MDIKPALDLLADRRRTNGYADLADLAEACGIDCVNDPAAARDLAEQLADDRNIAVRRPIGINDVTEYRLLT